MRTHKVYHGCKKRQTVIYMTLLFIVIFINNFATVNARVGEFMRQIKSITA